MVFPPRSGVKGGNVRIKQRPEDFRVTESFRFRPSSRGRYRVYLMDKQKLSTFEAVDQIRQRFGLPRGSISFCGLKDKQGRTEQLIAVDGEEVEMQEPRLRLKYLGRTDEPLTAANTTSNRFSVTVRALTEQDLGPLNQSVAEVSRLGVVNYFDSQRFGSLKHGQGFIAKDLIRGDFEAALRNYLAKPSPLDHSEDAKVKAFWGKHWGEWNRRVPFEANRKYQRILRVLRENPTDFVSAFLEIERNYRALILFTYQSFLWNEGVRRLLQLLLPREHLFPHPYQAGTLLFHRDASPEVLGAGPREAYPRLTANRPSAKALVLQARRAPDSRLSGKAGGRPRPARRAQSRPLQAERGLYVTSGLLCHAGDPAVIPLLLPGGERAGDYRRPGESPGAAPTALPLDAGPTQNRASPARQAH